MQAQTERALRFAVLFGLLLLEVLLVGAFYVITHFQGYQSPALGNWRLETPLSSFPGRLAVITFFVIFVFGNAGLIFLVWRAFKASGLTRLLK